MRRHKGKGGYKHGHLAHSKKPLKRNTTTKERRKPMDLQTFKNYNTARADLDDLVAMAAFGRTLRAEYEAHQIEDPEFVGAKLKSLRAEIADRNADKIAARKSEIKARLDALKSPKEKAAELRKELEALTAVGA
jgi:hypothetical protein